MTPETYIDDEALIDLLTLPHPMREWVSELAITERVGRLNFCGGFNVTLEELTALLGKADLPGVLDRLH